MIKIKEYPKLSKVWNKLTKQLPKEYRSIQILVAFNNMKDYELRKGGYANKNIIVIGKELADLKNEYIYLTLLAHELGHHVLGHMIKYDESNSSNEYDADMFGLFLAMKAGYDKNKYLKASEEFENWRRKGINKNHVKSHNTGKARNKFLEDQIKYINEINENNS